MAPPIRKTRFVPEWIDMGPKIPAPRIDWIHEKLLDVPYGGAPLQRMDIYYPNEKKMSYPVLILVHGGGFTHCDKRDWHVYPGFHALGEGFALVSVNYRLAPADPFPAAVEDLKDAVAYLRENAGDLKLESDNFFLYGTSAGGNLVSCVGLDGATSRGTRRDYRVNAVAALCPVINFKECVEQAPRLLLLLPAVRKLFDGYLGGMPQKLPQKAFEASADSRISEDPPAFYLQHGTRDHAVNYAQSVNFHAKLKATGLLKDKDLVLDLMEGVAHAGAGPEYLEPEHVMPILNFFKAHIKQNILMPD